MPGLMIAIVVIGGCTLLSIVGLIGVRRMVSIERLRAHHEVGGYMLSVLGTLYAIVLGFVVVNVSSGTESAKANISNEINAMLNITRYAEALPAKSKDLIDNACIEYCDAVINDEWNEMEQGIISTRAARAMSAIWGAMKQCEPATNKQTEVYGAMLGNYTEMADARRIRLITAPGQVSPILWMVLICGAVLTIGFTYFFATESVVSQALMTACVALTLALNLYLVVIYSRPFTGDFSIKPSMYRRATMFIKLKGVIPERTSENLRD